LGLIVIPSTHGQALAESLQINGSLGQLALQNNNIGDPGTEAQLNACPLV
jgi:hypothetical protein